MSAVLAHLSDPHLPLEGLPTPSELMNKRAISLLSWLGNRRRIHQSRPLAAVMRDIVAHQPDALAIAGDLTNLGTRAECLTAARWLRHTGFPRLVIPGNHDMLVAAPWEDGPGLWGIEGGLTDPDTPRVLRVGDVALIGINSGIPTLPFFASGCVSEAQQDKLATILRATGREGLCRIVMIHHPPRKDMVLWHKALRHADHFAQTVRRAGAEMVLHGHSHQGTVSTLPGCDIPVIGVTSASHRPGHRLDRAAGWNRITVEKADAATAWTLTVEARRLSPDGRLHTFRTWRFDRPVTGAANAFGEPAP
ncbi:metallophosphoesterase family protein [Acetobacter conturbans]|uniref:Metallophosphoesterase n=1 Tax=Acetobacter conturbans TaxID=1737472 RepID=A0ABX0JZY0_9PROT|nr:metallophosphoesterase [Acetobacter conturbans]NHN89027.1 metallophosphoesterase [Acetobacter conturbans]